MDTSNRLVDQPAVEDALRLGQLSAAQAALVPGAAAANPAEETRLVELAARVLVPELRGKCAGSEPRRIRIRRPPPGGCTTRRLRRWTDSEGFWNLHAKGTPQAGAAFNTVINPIIDGLFQHAYRAGRR